MVYVVHLTNPWTKIPTNSLFTKIQTKTKLGWISKRIKHKANSNQLNTSPSRTYKWITLREPDYSRSHTRQHWNHCTMGKEYSRIYYKLHGRYKLLLLQIHSNRKAHQTHFLCHWPLVAFDQRQKIPRSKTHIYSFNNTTLGTWDQFQT